jgi:hypothetical protein
MWGGRPGEEGVRLGDELLGHHHCRSHSADLKQAPVRRSNIQGANQDEWGPAGQFVGFFRPPVSSNYSFISAADDLSRVWINLDRLNMSKMHLLLDTRDWMPSRDW